MTRRTRTRHDLCPGVLRPWPAEDGALVRLRLVGGEISSAALEALGSVAREYGDGDVHLTRRANLQLRGLPVHDGTLPADVVEAVTATGLLPSPSHELVRNIMVSPLSGLAGGRADLRPVARALDAALCADPVLAALPGRFLFVLDDGRGDLVDRPVDVGLMVLDASTAQLRVGDGWGPVTDLADAPAAMLAVAREFTAARGRGSAAAWHVSELDTPLRCGTHGPDPRTRAHTAPLPSGPVEGAALEHVYVPDGLLGPARMADLLGTRAASYVVTPWHGLLVPQRTSGAPPAYPSAAVPLG